MNDPNISPTLGDFLAAASVTLDGQPNRQWFEESCSRSQRALAFAREQIDRELDDIVREGYGDRDNH